MKILVTGATGFIGRHLVTALLERNYEIKIFARDEDKSRKLFSNNVEFIFGDISNEDKIKESLAGIDLVYHLAAIRGENKLLDKDDYFKNNVLPTISYCKYCIKKNIKLIYLSSSGVTGWPKKLPIDESYQYEGLGLYHWSKIESEKEILINVKKGLHANIVRTVMVYGKDDDGFLFKLINRINNRKFLIIGNGKNRIHLLNVNNLIYGMLKILDIPTSGNIFFMADEEPITINELSGIISNKLNINISPIKIPISVAKYVAFILDILSSLIRIEFPLSMSTINLLTKDRYYSIDKAKKELGFYGGDVRQYIKDIQNISCRKMG